MSRLSTGPTCFSVAELLGLGVRLRDSEELPLGLEMFYFAHSFIRVSKGHLLRLSVWGSAGCEGYRVYTSSRSLGSGGKADNVERDRGDSTVFEKAPVLSSWPSERGEKPRWLRMVKETNGISAITT